MRLRRRHALLALVCWVPFAGCFCATPPGSVLEDTPRGQALKRIKTENRQIDARLEGAALPIELSPVVIEEDDFKPIFGKDKKRYRAVLPWKLTAHPEALLKQLHEQTRKAHPDAGPGAPTFTFDLVYIGEDGKTIDKEQVRSPLVANGKQVLQKLGHSGVPATVSVRPISFDWRENNVVVPFANPPSAVTAIDASPRIALNVPTGVPFALELVREMPAKEGGEVAPPASHIHYKRTGEEAMRKLLGGAPAPARPADFLAFTVTILDAGRRAVQTARLEISLRPGKDGASEPFLLDVRDAPYSLKIEPRELRWDGRNFVVKF